MIAASTELDAELPVQDSFSEIGFSDGSRGADLLPGPPPSEAASQGGVAQPLHSIGRLVE